MPVVGEFHVFYWRSKAGGGGGGGGGVQVTQYPAWQSGPPVLLMMVTPWGLLYLGLQRVWAFLRDGWRLARAVRQFDRGQRAALDRTLMALQRSEYRSARHIVREIATTLGFAEAGNPITLDLWRKLKRGPGEADNCWRHMHACERLRSQYPLTNPEANLLSELAYQEFAALGHSYADVR